MTDEPTPGDVLDELDVEAECIHIEKPNETLIWAHEDGDHWCLLEKTPSGTWYPNPRISHSEMVAALLGDAATYRISPLETTIPDGRLPNDR